MSNSRKTLALIACSTVLVVLLTSISIIIFFPSSNTRLIITSSHTFGGPASEYVYSMINTSDGGYILAGFTSSFGAGNDDAWLIKVDSTGNHQWNRTYGGNAEDVGISVIATADGGYALTGITSSYGAGNLDAWVIKTDATGQEEWSQAFGGSKADYAGAITLTATGGLVIAGYTESFGEGNRDFWLIEINGTGHQVWSQTFGGSASDHASAVLATTDGGYLVAGVTESYGAGSKDAWIIKTDSTGHHIWNRTLGGRASDIPYTIVSAPGGFVLTGRTGSYDANVVDAWLVKVDNNGNPEWNYTYGGEEEDYTTHVVSTIDGGYVLTGRTGSYGEGAEDAWLVKTTATGQLEWSQTFGGSAADASYSVIVSSDGGYVLAGRTGSYGEGAEDVWFIKTAFQNDGTFIDGTPWFEAILMVAALSAFDLFKKRKRK
ncbi:MAG: hypothetical protein ACFFD4_32930 [Candidatus Odinarchaeota archaeon]